MQRVSKSYLYNLPKHRGSEDNLQLLRVIRAAEYLRVDFGYHTTDYYTRGGWVRMSPDTFIRDIKTRHCYKLLRAEKIPIAPDYLNFKSTIDWLYFSLYFEPLPDSTLVFDLIESEPGALNDFNYFNILLKVSERLVLKSV